MPKMYFRPGPTPRLMPGIAGILLALVFLQPAVAHADWWWSDSAAQPPRVQVVEPFAPWHTGPASGYPVTRVSERGERLQLLMRKTRWMKVRDDKGREGWVRVSDIGLTRDAQGEPVQIGEPGFEDFTGRTWELGLMLGDFEGATVNSINAGYWMTENLAIELSGSQVLGNASEILMANANLVHQPFPRWRISPFFTLGLGQLFIDPKASLAEPENRSNLAAHAGAGLRFYVTDRYFLRAEVKDYTVFTDRKTNEEAFEWKVGLSIFF